MHFIITDVRWAKSRTLHLTGTRLALAVVLASSAFMALSMAVYHWVFLTGARQGWPLVASVAGLASQSDMQQRERFLRENLDAMARKLGEMQAKLVQLEVLGERVSGLAGINPQELKAPAGQGGALVNSRPLSIEELQANLAQMDRFADQRNDWLTALESRLFDQKVRAMMVPTRQPVAFGELGSSFGWRIDPFTGRSAWHTGLDFQAASGTPILAAAGGIVVAAEVHPAYGNMVEIDHGNEWVTRYAHASRLLVKKGDLVKWGQKVAEVGTTGRSTGPHLHFEVLVHGVAQDPQKFLSAGAKLPGGEAPLAFKQASQAPVRIPGG